MEPCLTERGACCSTCLGSLGSHQLAGTTQRRGKLYTSHLHDPSLGGGGAGSTRAESLERHFPTLASLTSLHPWRAPLSLHRRAHSRTVPSQAPLLHLAVLLRVVCRFGCGGFHHRREALLLQQRHDFLSRPRPNLLLVRLPSRTQRVSLPKLASALYGALLNRGASCVLPQFTGPVRVKRKRTSAPLAS